jgi:hypothetical protein
MSLQVTRLGRPLLVTAHPPAERPAAASRRAATLWEEEVARHPGRFDGRILSLVSGDADGLAGEWVPYSWAMAQRRERELFDDLRVRPLAVSGLLACPEGLVIGRRSVAMASDGGLWELVPSGGIDPRSDRGGAIDLAAMILAELHEEIGLAAEVVEVGAPFVVVEDDDNHVVDIGLPLSTRQPFTAIAAAFAPLAGREYDALGLIPDAAGPRPAGLVPVSAILLDHCPTAYQPRR